MRRPGWSSQDLASLDGRFASDVHSGFAGHCLLFIPVCSLRDPGQVSVTCLLPEHCSLWCCHPEPPLCHGSEGQMDHNSFVSIFGGVCLFANPGLCSGCTAALDPTLEMWRQDMILLTTQNT